MVIKKFRKNEVILHEENTSEYMYIILDGEAKVVQVTGEGKGIIVTMHRTGDFFGELSLIDGKTVAGHGQGKLRLHHGNHFQEGLLLAALLSEKSAR